MEKRTLKILGLLLFALLAIVLLRFSSISSYLTVESIDSLVESFGVFAPLAFIVVYAVGICLFVPGTLLTGAGAVVFGTTVGFVVNYIGACIGSVGAFFIGRYLGRDFAAGLIGKKLKKYDDALEQKGFSTILYLRLLFFPFTPLNFGAGLTKIRFRDYFFGTVIGILPGSFIWTFAIATISIAFTSGDYSLLLSGQTILAVGLFIFSFFIPPIIKRTRFAKQVGV